MVIAAANISGASWYVGPPGISTSGTTTGGVMLH